jgi:hypothetical protein
MKLIFERGDQQSDETKPETISRSLRVSDDKTFEFRNEFFTRDCSFFIDKGEVEAKLAKVKIVKL